MALLFKRKHEIEKPEDPGAKLVNRILMIGLVVFLGFSVLNEKRTLETQKLIWQANSANLITGTADKVQVTEGKLLEFKVSAADIEKIKTMPHDADGKITLFSLKLDRVVVNQPAPDTKPKQNLPAEPKPATAQKEPAKTNVIP